LPHAIKPRIVAASKATSWKDYFFPIIHDRPGS
jgi:hypothetical protein